MHHTAAIDLYNQIVAHKSDSTVINPLFDQLCELILRDYPAPDSSMQAELDALFNQEVTPAPDFQDVTTALVPLFLLRQIVGTHKVAVHPKHCVHWGAVANVYRDIICNHSPNTHKPRT